MKRREFSAAAATTLVGGLAQAQVAPAVEAKEYKVLAERMGTDAGPGQVEVIEFFWYSCPHCNAFEPTLASWIKAAPKDVLFKRVPVAFRSSFVPQQRLYYALEALNKLDELHHKVFNAIHVERQALDKDETVMAWAEKQGINKAKFTEVYQSFSMAGKLRRAVQLQDAFKVEGVPALGIAGRWYTDGTLSGNMNRALRVADHLIAEARKGR